LKLKIINDYHPKLSYNLKLFKKLIKKIFNDYNITDVNLSIILSNKNLLNKLKKDYFNLDQYTDVIVFNLENENEPIDGEIYLSIDDVLFNSKKYLKTFDNELKRVVIHGVLHLLGFEDSNENKKKEMTELEEKYILYKLSNSLIDTIK